MKKCILFLLAILFLVACEKEDLNDSLSEKEAFNFNAVNFKTHAQSIDVCHFDAINDTWKVIKISENALKAHVDHGDAVDMDEDGYFNTENGCSEVDCDDDDPQVYPGANEICGDGIDNNCDGQVDENCGVPNELFAEYAGNGGAAYNDFYPSGRIGLIIIQEDTAFDVIWFEELSFVDYACIEYHSTIEEYDRDNQTGVFRFRLVRLDGYFCSNDKFTDEFIDFAFNGSTLELKSFDTGAVIGTLVRQ